MFVILLTALSLSMDAFSLAIIYGTKETSEVKKIVLSILVGINHFFLPIIGKMTGDGIFSNKLINPSIITMIVFSIIGLEMIISEEKDAKVSKLGILEIVIFAVSVSIDSFIVGITYHKNTKILLSSLLFMLFSGFLTFVGLKIGTKIGHKIGIYARKIGGVLLIVIGLYSLLA